MRFETPFENDFDLLHLSIFIDFVCYFPACIYSRGGPALGTQRFLVSFR